MILPTGTVTFLFTDIEGSTKLWDQVPDQMRRALARHDTLMREAIESNDGIVFKTVGDAFCAAFSTAAAAVSAAIAAQLALEAEIWDLPAPVRARMGIHSGSVENTGDDYFGPALNRVARLMSIGHGGQILMSAVSRELAQDFLTDEVGLIDLGSHRLKDLGRPEEVFQVRRPGLRSEFAPLRSLGNPALPNNLPQQVTSFVGREKETADVERLLATTQMLTLTAPGGSGKTRLSLQVAANVIDAYPDGAWFVELAHLTEPGAVAQEIARILNVPEAAGTPVLQNLVNSLRASHLLIVLDNCEHLVAACAEVATALLRGCSSIKILASSRQGMNVGGEALYAVPPLALPDPRRPQTAASLSQFEAVRLFVDRAIAVRPDFAVNNQNAPALAQLCCHLDGIPLALELAAARVRMLSVEDINGRLDNRFRLLTGGSRTSLPRQQTLKALIDWSYDLLSEPEQALFSRLSVFSDGWSLDAAETICAGEDVDAWDVFDLLTSLSDKSLVVCDAQNADTRFRLLETLRDYGREKLQASGSAEEIHERHAAFFAGAVAERAGVDEVPQEAIDWLAADAGNIRAALEWLWAAARYTDASLLTVHMREFWTQKGWLREASSNVERAVQHADALESVTLQARVYKDAGRFAFLLNDLPRAESQYARALDAARSCGDAALQAHCLNGMALTAKSQNDVPRAEELFVEAIAILRGLDRDLDLAYYLMNLGHLEAASGKREEADTRFTEAIALYEKHSNERGIAHWQCYQSDLAIRDRDWERAQTMAESSAQRFRRIDDRLGLAYALANLAEAASRRQQTVLAESSVREAVEICRETSHFDILPVLLTSLARELIADGRLDDAAVAFCGAARTRALLNAHLSPGEEHDAGELQTALLAAGPEVLERARSAVAAAATPEQILERALAPGR